MSLTWSTRVSNASFLCFSPCSLSPSFFYLLLSLRCLSTSFCSRLPSFRSYSSVNSLVSVYQSLHFLKFVWRFSSTWCKTLLIDVTSSNTLRTSIFESFISLRIVSSFTKSILSSSPIFWEGCAYMLARFWASFCLKLDFSSSVLVYSLEISLWMSPIAAAN